MMRLLIVRQGTHARPSPPWGQLMMRGLEMDVLSSRCERNNSMSLAGCNTGVFNAATQRCREGWKMDDLLLVHEVLIVKPLRQICADACVRDLMLAYGSMYTGNISSWLPFLCSDLRCRVSFERPRAKALQGPHPTQKDGEVAHHQPRDLDNQQVFKGCVESQGILTGGQRPLVQVRCPHFDVLPCEGGQAKTTRLGATAIAGGGWGVFGHTLMLRAMWS